MTMRAVAPGRVNLIGDHVDYTGGLVLPMAIDRHTTISFERTDGTVDLDSREEPGHLHLVLGREFDPEMTPRWGRYVAAVAHQIPGALGLSGSIATDIPVGGGLSSSAALEVAAALALGFEGSATDLAELARRAEHLATGVPTGIMDQLCIASARAGHASLIDCASLEVTHVPVPDDVAVVVRFVAHRTLVGSEYADRVAQCAAVEAILGPLRDASIGSLAHIPDETLRRRARHVITENARVRGFAEALSRGDHAAAGAIMVESHRSLAEDFEVSTPRMDRAVRDMVTTDGVFGARMTGGGFGGCVVALCAPDAEVEGWRVSPAGSAHLD
jgi:galactokinase